MLIILEGCDGTGKTTLANMLKPLLGAEIVHCTTQTPNTYGFFNNIIYAAQKKHIIVDRFCYSQFVYQEEEDRPLALHEIYPLDGDRRFVENSYESLARLEIDMLQADMCLLILRLYIEGLVQETQKYLWITSLSKILKLSMKTCGKEPSYNQ